MAGLFCLLVSFLLLVVVAAGDDYFCSRSCPPFWTSFGRSCYRYFGEPRTWLEAEENCNTFASSRGLGHLVSIVSDDENTFLVQMINGIRTLDTSLSETCKAHQDTSQAGTGEQKLVSDVTPKTSLTWLGITDLKKEGALTWTDGTKLVYTNWAEEIYIENTENRDARDYKGRKHGEDRDEKHTDQSISYTAGNTCGYIPVSTVSTVSGKGRIWDKTACNDTAAISPYVCRIIWT